MTQKSGMKKTSQQRLTRVLEQMEHWRNHNSRLVLSIDTGLFRLCLRGRLVGRLERLFLFDTYSGVCRIPIIPEQYDRSRWTKKDPASETFVTFENSGMPGRIELREDEAGPMFEEMSHDWILSNMCAEGAASKATD